ncbi:MAG: RimK family alpha-L-glutamate ligase [Planctomycetales bacterium]|nr:RimK family alpha-L-glutamate ligase [Planctomycetales bacterium]
MTTRIGVLSTPDSPYLAELQHASERIESGALEIVPLRFQDLWVGLTSQKELSSSELVFGCSNNSGVNHSSLTQLRLDAIIVRSMPLGSLEQVIFRMDTLGAIQRQDVPIFNSPRCLEISIDKWLTLERFNAAHLPLPNTIVCQCRATAMEAFEVLGCDVLVKPLFGGEGRGILRLHDKDLAWRVFGTLQQMGQVIYVQEFVEHLGYDIRILIIGNQYWGIKRLARAGEWRTNLSQGNLAEPHEVTDRQLQMARAATEAVGGDIVGVDILPTRDGREVLLEVNAVPGWKGLSATLDVDIAAEVLRFVAASVESSR